MNRTVINISVLILCCILSSCGVYYIDLGNHYAWLEDRVIVKITEETKKSLYYDCLIRPQVLNYDYDDTYIIAYQVYDGSIDYDSCQRPEEKDSLRIQFKRLEEMKHCYWIINKETGRIIGPMKKNEFDLKCKTLNVRAKMRHSQEEKFWKGSSIEEINVGNSVQDTLLINTKN
jgi:hypothetical protein